MKKLRAGLKLNRNGATSVEFALVLGIFLLFIFGIFDFGTYFHRLHTLKHAVREGARFGMTGGTLTGENPTDSIIKTIEDSASPAVKKEEIDIRVFEVLEPLYTDPGGWETMSPDAGVGMDFMRIKVRHTYNFINPLIGVFFTDGEKEILTETTYRNEDF